MPNITFDMIRAELGRLAFENMVLRAELAEAKAAPPTLEPLPDEEPDIPLRPPPPDRIVRSKTPAPIRDDMENPAAG